MLEKREKKANNFSVMVTCNIFRHLFSPHAYHYINSVATLNKSFFLNSKNKTSNHDCQNDKEMYHHKSQ